MNENLKAPSRIALWTHGVPLRGLLRWILSCHPNLGCHPEPGRRFLATEREGSAFAVRSRAELIAYHQCACVDLIQFA